MEDWKAKLVGILPDLKDQRIRELELEVGRLEAENRSLRGKLSTKEKQLASRETEKAQLQHSRHRTLDRRVHLEAVVDAQAAELADLKKRIDKARRALDS